MACKNHTKSSKESGKADPAPTNETLDSELEPKKLTPIPPPTDRITRLSTGSTKPIPIDPNNSEVPRIRRRRAVANLAKKNGKAGQAQSDGTDLSASGEVNFQSMRIWEN